MTNRVDFGDVITAMVTPFDKDGHVDFDTLKSLANYLLKNGTDTLLLNGSTGEAEQLDSDEKQAIVKHVRASTPPKTCIIVATSDTNTNRSILKAQQAFEDGADAILVSVPPYIKPSQKALEIYFGSIAKAIDNKPMMIYNIPGRTSKEILPKTVAKLAHAHPNIVGIKQSMGDMDKVTELKLLTPMDFQIYSGDDSLTLPMLSLGAKGVVSVMSHLEGKLLKSMVRYFKEARLPQAQQCHFFLHPLFSRVTMHDQEDVFANPLPIKEALYQRHLIVSPKARTLEEMSERAKDDMKQCLSQIEDRKRYISAMILPSLRDKKDNVL